MDRHFGKHRTMLEKSRWFKETNYSDHWKPRNVKLIDMFLRSQYSESRKYLFAEFGSGPTKPIATYCERFDNIFVQGYDLKSWDNTVEVIDLNKQEIPQQKFDVCVFSGVLEYLDDFPSVLHNAMANTRFVLLSYAHMPSELSDMEYTKKLQERARQNGWRSHFRLPDFVDLVSRLGGIVDVDTWEGQILLCVESFRFKD